METIENFDIVLYGKEYQVNFEVETEVDNGSYSDEHGLVELESYEQITNVVLDSVIDNAGEDITAEFNNKFIEEMLSTKHEAEIIKILNK